LASFSVLVLLKVMRFLPQISPNLCYFYHTGKTEHFEQ